MQVDAQIGIVSEIHELMQKTPDEDERMHIYMHIVDYDRNHRLIAVVAGLTGAILPWASSMQDANRSNSAFSDSCSLVSSFEVRQTIFPLLIMHPGPRELYGRLSYLN